MTEMTTFKHTPGPWVLKEDLGIPLQILGKGTEKNPRYNPVTRCGTTFICPSSEEAMENARLIAAAPCLLELLVESQTNIGGDWRQRRDALIESLTPPADER